MRTGRVLSHIICMVIIISMAVIFGCKAKEEKQVFENGMNKNQNMGFALAYKLECNQESVFALDITQDLEFYPTRDTEMLIGALNHEIWDYQYSTGKETINEMKAMAREVCEKYGITNKNRLTVEWALENQYDAFSLYEELPGVLTSIVGSLYKKIYERNNLGGEEGDPQPNPEE